MTSLVAIGRLVTDRKVVLRSLVVKVQAGLFLVALLAPVSAWTGFDQPRAFAGVSVFPSDVIVLAAIGSFFALRYLSNEDQQPRMLDTLVLKWPLLLFALLLLPGIWRGHGRRGSRAAGPLLALRRRGSRVRALASPRRGGRGRVLRLLPRLAGPGSQREPPRCERVHPARPGGRGASRASLHAVPPAAGRVVALRRAARARLGRRVPHGVHPLEPRAHGRRGGADRCARFLPRKPGRSGRCRPRLTGIPVSGRHPLVRLLDLGAVRSP